MTKNKNDRQLSLVYGGFPPYQRESETSLAAAEDVAPRTETLREQAHAAIGHAEWYGLTDEEGAYKTGMRYTTFVPRRRELFLEGEKRPGEPGNVVDSGRRRKTTSGSTAVVWVLEMFCWSLDENGKMVRATSQRTEA